MVTRSAILASPPPTRGSVVRGLPSSPGGTRSAAASVCSRASACSGERGQIVVNDPSRGSNSQRAGQNRVRHGFGVLVECQWRAVQRGRGSRRPDRRGGGCFRPACPICGVPSQRGDGGPGGLNGVVQRGAVQCGGPHQVGPAGMCHRRTIRAGGEALWAPERRPLSAARGPPLDAGWRRPSQFCCRPPTRRGVQHSPAIPSGHLVGRLPGRNPVATWTRRSFRTKLDKTSPSSRRSPMSGPASSSPAVTPAAGNGAVALDNLGTEDRTFPPSAEFAANANLSAEAYERAAADPDGVLGGAGEPADLGDTVHPGVGLVRRPAREVVRRREAERRGELRGPARGRRTRAAGRDPLGRRTRRHPHHHLQRPAHRGEQNRERPGVARVEGR